MREAESQIQRDAAVCRPENQPIDLVDLRPRKGGLDQLDANTAARGGRDVQVRKIRVQLRFRRRVGNLLDRLHPHRADDQPVRVDRRPRVPAVAFLQFAPHPADAATHEHLARLGRRIPPERNSQRSSARRLASATVAIRTWIMAGAPVETATPHSAHLSPTRVRHRTRSAAHRCPLPEDAAGRSRTCSFRITDLCCHGTTAPPAHG